MRVAVLVTCLFALLAWTGCGRGSSPTAPTTSTTAAPPPAVPADLSGRWLGSGNTGDYFCEEFFTLQLVIEQTGGNITGTVTKTFMSYAGDCGGPIGTAHTGSLSGSVTGSAVTFGLEYPHLAESVTGSITGTRMTGLIENVRSSGRGTVALERQ